MVRTTYGVQPTKKLPLNQTSLQETHYIEAMPFIAEERAQTQSQQMELDCRQMAPTTRKNNRQWLMCQ